MYPVLSELGATFGFLFGLSDTTEGLNPQVTNHLGFQIPECWMMTVKNIYVSMGWQFYPPDSYLRRSPTIMAPLVSLDLLFKALRDTRTANYVSSK